MARPKGSKNKPKEGDVTTMENPIFQKKFNDSLLHHLLEFQMENLPHQHLRPFLYAPTGAGKTSRIEQWAKDKGMPVKRLLLQSMLPEDILGLPRVINGETRWSLPEWAPELINKPGILFLDEADKARSECHAVILTLAAEKRIRDTYLHPQTLVVFAGQPQDNDIWLGDETGKALVARMVFLPMSYDWDFLTNKTGVTLEGMPVPPTPKVPKLQSPSPRQVEWFISFVRNKNTTEDMAKSVADILFDGEVKSLILERVSEIQTTITRDDIQSVLKEEGGKNVLPKLSIQEMGVLAAEIWSHCTPTEIGSVLEKIWIEGNEDDAKVFLENTYNGLLAMIDASSEHEIDIGRGCTEDEMHKAIIASIKAIATAWKARAK